MLDLRKAMGIKDFTWGDALSGQDPRKSLEYLEHYNGSNRSRDNDLEIKMCSGAANQRIWYKRRLVKIRQCLVVSLGIGFPLLVNLMWWTK